MEIESHKIKEKKDPILRKVKTPLRIRYEVQASNIQGEIGDLESIRMRLGLSKRKICQLLLIDPSSWTRWTNFSGSKPPPHIYRMLQWYLLLKEKHPEMHPDYWLRTYTNQSVGQSYNNMEKVVIGLKDELNKEKKRLYFMVLMNMMLLSITILLFFYQMNLF